MTDELFRQIVIFGGGILAGSGGLVLTVWFFIRLFDWAAGGFGWKWEGKPPTKKNKP